MKKGLLLVLFFLVFPALLFAANDYNPQGVGAGNPELHIKADGTVSLKSGKIDQVVGTTFYLGLRWGGIPMRFTMKTDAGTKVTKRYGGGANASQIGVGDYVDVEGIFFVGSDFFGVNALSIKDWSLQEESGTFAGVITEIQIDHVFLLRTTQNQTITVRMATTSSDIKKGSVTIPFERLKKGDAVPLAGGVYDYSKNTLTATRLVVYQNKSEFLPRNFEGTLKEVISANIPASIIVTVGGKDHVVKINEKTAVQKKNKTAGQLARFVTGDTVRFYGAVREEDKTLSDYLIVDAEIVRNLSL